MSHSDPRTRLDSTEDHEPPGGATVNRVATVATSAALGGAAAGALAGAMGGPAGAAVGAAIGAIAAGMAGNAVADSIDKEAEDHYWRSQFSQRSYAGADADYDDFGPAYRYGVDNFVQHRGRRFEDVEDELAQRWSASRGTSRLDWDRARPASRDSWQRLSDTFERAVPGDSDRDGR